MVAGAGVGADADKNIYGVGACTGAHKKKECEYGGEEVVGQSEKNAGAGSGCVPAEVEDKLMGVGAGTVVLVAGHQTR